MKVFVIVFCCIFYSIQLYAGEMIVTYRAPESENDTRFNYPLALIKAAMEVTKDQYGGYRLVEAPDMNFQRARQAGYIEKFENFVFETAASRENESSLLSIKVPIAKGLYGFRIFLIQAGKQSLFDRVSTLDELKKLSIGLERTWPDVPILQKNGFKVVMGGEYEGLFRMLVHGRFDGFSRGVNEAFHEQGERVDSYPGLAVEKSLCLYYPLPRYFYTTKKNTAFAQRLTKGLESLLSNGTFDKIWFKHHKRFLEQAKLEKRKVLRISNPFIPDSVPLDDPKYWYVP